MVAVFAIFATLSLIDLQEFGVGLAAAVLIDATLIRGVVLPASMKLLGKWNWCMPRSLSWLPVPRRGAAAPSARRHELTPDPHSRTTRRPATRRAVGRSAAVPCRRADRLRGPGARAARGGARGRRGRLRAAGRAAPRRAARPLLPHARLAPRRRGRAAGRAAAGLARARRASTAAARCGPGSTGSPPTSASTPSRGAPSGVLPIDHGPADGPARRRPGEPLAEAVWVEPYPDERLGRRGRPRRRRRRATSSARASSSRSSPRSSTCRARQRAVLILREVLGFSAAEVAEALDDDAPRR